MNPQILPVPFHEDVVVLVNDDGDPFVAMKPVAENMGLAWQSQHAKLTEKFASTITIIVTVAEDGKPREMVCLPLRKLPAWLYSINPAKVAPELRDKIVRYQEECDDALWNYWTQDRAERNTRQPSTYEQLSAHGVRLKLLKALKTETNRELRDAISQQLEHTSRLLGLPVPDADKIGRAAPLMPECVTRFWMAVEQIGLDKLNHCNDPGLIGINLNQFADLADELRVPVPARLELKQSLRDSTDPEFVEVRTVRSGLGGKRGAADPREVGHVSATVRCWVFRKSAAT